MGVFVMPSTAKADWADILGSIGIGGMGQSHYSNNYYNQNSFDYNSTDSSNTGDIKMSKEVRLVGNSKYHDKISIRSGSAVEVWIEVKNTSSRYSADTVIRDEISGNTVYVKNSLRVNGQASQPGLTSTGLRINIPAKSKVVITYQMNVCSGTGYPMRAYASAPSIGAATDAIIIYTENFSVGYYDQTYSCVAQFQDNSSGNTSYSNNPFSGWTGVNNSTNTTTNTSTPMSTNNPFGDWAGVNNLTTATTTAPNVTTSPKLTNNPFGDWAGVDNATSITSHTTTPVNANNPFGDWYGVQPGETISTAFGTRSDGSNKNSTDPFGDWYGVNNSVDQFNESGYSTSRNSNYGSDSDMVNRTSVSYKSGGYQTHFIAPTTGVNKTAPFIFAGLITVGFILVRKRKLFFN